MHSQQNLAIYTGTLVGTIVYLFYSFIYTDRMIDLYASLRFVGLILIPLSCIIAGKFLFFFKIGTSLYEKVRYKGQRPHYENAISKEESYVIGIIVSVLLTSIVYLMFPSERLGYGILIGTFVTRWTKTVLMYGTGHPCRLYYPISKKIHTTTNLTPEPEIRLYWRPVQTTTFGILLSLYIITIPYVQNIALRIFIHFEGLLQQFGI